MIRVVPPAVESLRPTSAVVDAARAPTDQFGVGSTANALAAGLLETAPKTQLLQGLSKKSFALEIEAERDAALAALPESEAPRLKAFFEAAAHQGGFYSPVTGKIVFERTPSTELKLEVASHALVDTLPAHKLELLVGHLEAVGVATDATTAAKVVGEWNALGADVLRLTSALSETNPERASQLRHTNRVLSANVDETGALTRRGGEPLADFLGLRLHGLKPSSLDALISNRSLARGAASPDALGGVATQAPKVPHVSMPKAEVHEYFTGLLRDNWQFFEDTVGPETHYLPVDNILKTGETFEFDRRTSPTNIGLYMLCVVGAEKLGFITTDQMKTRLRQTTDSVQALLASDSKTKQGGVQHLFNWYDLKGEPRRMGTFISSVDNGNFSASLLAVSEAVKNVDPLLAKELGALTDTMSMSFFYNRAEGQLSHGVERKGQVANRTSGTYDLMLTEARLAVMTGVLKGQIPAETWSNMKPKLDGEFAPGSIELNKNRPMQSWTDTVFEVRLPSMFTKTAGTIHGVADEQVLQTHLNDPLRIGKTLVWGRSEAKADGINGGTYAAFGSTDAMSKDYSVDTFKADVVAPYASLMLSDLAPGEVVQNMRALESLGVRGKYGMYESIATDADGKPVVTERFFSHHKAMEMLGMLREVNDFVPDLMHGSALNQGKVIEGLQSTPLSKHRQPLAVGAVKKASVQSAYEASASYPLEHVVGNGPLVAYAATAVGSTLWMNPNYTLSRGDAFIIKDNRTGQILPFKQEAPTRVTKNAEGTLFEYDLDTELGRLTVKQQVSVPTSQTKVSTVTVENHTGQPQSLNITGFTRPVLDDPNAVIAHPGFRDLFVHTVLHEGAVVARRRVAGEEKQKAQPYFVFGLQGQDGTKFDWADGSRANFLGRDGVAADPEAVRAEGHVGKFGFTQSPGAAISKSLELPAKGSASLSFVSGFTTDASQIGALLGRGAAGAPLKSEAAIQYPPNGTHELMNAFAVQELFNRSVRPTANVGPKLPVEALGTFTNNGRTFRIENPASLPRAWAQVYTNGLTVDGLAEATYANASTVGGAGYSMGGTEAHGVNAQRLRATEWDPDNITDVPRTGVVVRDVKSGKAWSIALNPKSDPDGTYAAEVEPGTMTYFHEGQEGLKTSLTKFVAPRDPTELWKIEVENTGSTTRELDFESFMRLAMGKQFPQTDFETNTRFDAERGVLFSDNAASLVEGMVVVHSVVGDGTKAQRGSLFNSDENPTSGLITRVKVAPGEKKQIAFSLGMAEGMENAEAMLGRLGHIDQVNAALKASRDGVNRFLDVLQIETPDAELNTMMNHWLPYQTLMTHIQARTGHSQSGGGHGGRDQIQSFRNLMVRGDPTLQAATRKYLISHAAQQFPEGNMTHWWHTHDALGQNSTISDTALWGPYAVLEYVKKTGDHSLLDEQVPYLDGRPLNKGERDYVQNFKPTDYTESVYEHGKRAIDLIIDKRMGEHGLPLILGGDWNDALNAVGPAGKGESGWLAFFLFDNLTKFAEVARARNDLPTAVKYEKAAADLQANIMKHLWDAERGYFIRGFADNGEKLAFIDVIVQGWAAESGAVAAEFAALGIEKAFDALYREDTNTIGLLAANLGEEQWDGTVKNAPIWAGAAVEYPPDVRETGQYTHGVAFLMKGLTKLKLGDKALKAIRTGLPNVHAKREGYDAEPYALAADIQTKTGKAGWTHYSGASGWVMRATLEGLLGLDFRNGNRLFIDPAMPTEWPSFSATHTRGTAKYRIEVTNPDHVASGVRSVEVDGVAMPMEAYLANGVEIKDDGKKHVVKVVMGAVEAKTASASVAPRHVDWV